jgi:hypothetical protein
VDEPADGPDAARLAGLLADEDRRLVFAAVVLGAADLDGVARSTHLDPARAGRALTRLHDAGVLLWTEQRELALNEAALAGAARAARSAPRPDTAPLDPDALVLSRFVRDGRLVSIPASHAKRQVVLQHLAQQFEPGRHYSERSVNEILRRWHPDPAALRRYLVDDGFLDRAHGQYWRSGGPVEV